MADVWPPGPTGGIFAGNMRALRDAPLEFLLRCTRTYGDIVYCRIAGQRIFLINHPDLIKDVLVTHHRNFEKGNGRPRNKLLLGEGLLTSQGQYHHQQRLAIQPAFHRKRIAGYAAMMGAYSMRFVERWQAATSYDIENEMLDLSLAVVAKALFDIDVEGDGREFKAAFDELKLIATQLISRRTLPFVKLLDRLPLPANRRFRSARERFDGMLYHLIEQRRERAEDRGDVLSTLLGHTGTSGASAARPAAMSDQQIRDELVAIFVAGHDTIAQAMTWTWYLLSQHPAAEEMLHAELETVLGGSTPALEDVPRLRYTRMLLTEAMRLYPPFWLYHRRALAPYVIGPYTVPTGSVVLIASYAMHRDGRFFRDPERFDPLRWEDETPGLLPRFSYFPFGGGARQCIGESFAWMEGIIAIATIAQHWRLRVEPGHPIQPQPLITLRPKYGMPMRLEQREPSSVARMEEHPWPSTAS